VVNGVIDVNNAEKEPHRIPFQPDWINRFLGLELTADEMIAYMAPLDIKVEDGMCVVPSYRADLEQKADIAEEIARMYGYDKIPTTALRGSAEAVVTPEQNFERLICRAMIGMGYDEIITYSFMSAKMYDKICLPADSELRNSVVILNPLGEDTGIMRTTALPSMLDTLSRNYNNRNAEAYLFELSSEYLPREGEVLPLERAVLMLGCYGKGADFFTMKGHVEALLSQLNLPRADYTAVTDDPSYHPGRFAVISVNGAEIGSIGEVHPAVAENFELGERTYVARLDIAAMFAAQLPEASYRALPRFPASTRDLAVLCDEATPVAVIEKEIRDAVGSILEQVNLFDVYRGNQVPEGKKSVAYALVLRAADRTLTVEECDKAIEKVLKNLAKHGITLRA